MARRYFNWTLAVVLVVAMVVFAATVTVLHRWQKSTRAERALPLGEQAYEEKDWDKAADQLGRYLRVYGDDVAVSLKYADAQLRRRPVTTGQIQQAEGRYRVILRLDANNTKAAKELCTLYLSPSWPHPDQVELIASEYLQNNDDADIRRMLAESQIHLRKFREAANTLAALVEEHPDYVPAYGALGLLAAQRPADVNKPAADWFEEAIKVNPRSAMAYIIRGEYHRMRGQFSQALADFEQAGKQDLSDTEVRLRLAREFIEVGALDRAREHLTELQARIPTDSTVWRCWAVAVPSGSSQEEKAKIAQAGLTALGADPWDFMSTATELFIAAGQYEKAQDCIARMRQKDLQSGLIAFLEGLLAAAKGELSQGIALWHNAIAQGYKQHTYAGGCGETMPVRRLVARSLTRLGDTQSAVVQLQNYISESPASPGNIKDIMQIVGARLELAQLLLRRRDWTGVLDQTGQVQRFVPGHPSVILLESQARISLLSGGGDLPAGREAQCKLIEDRLAKLDEATRGSAQVQMLLVQTAMRRGDLAEAARRLKDAKDKHPSVVLVHVLEAELLAAQGRLNDVAASLQQTIKQFPQALEPVQSLALMLYRQENMERCESVVKEAIGRMEQPDSRRILGMLLADLYRRWGRQDELCRWLSNMAEQFPKDIQIQRGLLACPAIAKDAQQARALVDQIKSIEGESGWQWRCEQAKLWIDSNDFASRYAETVRYLQENLQTNPNDQTSRILLAMAHEKGGQTQLALSVYRDALNRSPNDMEVVTRTVSALFRVGGDAERKEAREILNKAKARQLHHPGLEQLELYGQHMQWQAQVRRGALGPASDTLEELLRRDPNDTTASLVLAQISMERGELEQAAILLRELRTKAPESYDLVRARIRLYVLQGNMLEALRLCDEAIQKHDLASAYVQRAWVYARLRDSDKALADFDRAVAKEPNNADIRVDRAAFCQSIGRRDESIRDIRQALSLASESPSVLGRAVPLCMTSGSRTLIHEAEEALDKARAADPNDPDLKVLKAQSLLARGNTRSVEQAQDLLREITSVQPEFSKAWHLLGRIQLEQGQPGALDTALRGLSFNERDKPLLLLRADAEAQRSPALAVPTLRALAQTYPGDGDVEIRLAGALYRSGDKEEARSMLETRMQDDPNNPVPWITLANLLARDERWENVTEQVAKWLSRHPDDTAVVSGVARSLMLSGDPKGIKVCEDLLSAALKRNPKSVPILASLALFMQNAGRTQEATSFNRRVVELDPNNVLAVNNLAWLLCEEGGQYEEALKLAERGIKIAPEYADLIDTRGVVHYRLGNLEEAAEDFSRCLQLYPADGPSVISCHIHLGRVYVKMGRKAQAQQHLQQAVDLHDRNPKRYSQVPGLSVDLAEARLLLEQVRKEP